ncbi:MAG: Gfo/Idh/MocA family oxidoreductase [Chloroflexi bacterium]|jgi:dihydrodiol dehydrogenase / D-xylose 1-dehydrogenase (NADP)|nr:Gfo/Idh/MocA family oxidoreductase [Chloroflexota bacterium]
MNATIGWGILGAGAIATRFATDIKNLPDARLVAVGSRSQDKAAAFAADYGVERAHGSYEALMSDPDVDAIYVATPHPFHCAHTIACLQHGKAVLCEKPMAINEGQVRQMVAAAQETGGFLMEAMWTRFLPVIAGVRQWLAEGKIGEPRIVKADFGFRSGWNPKGRLLNPMLAGGALLDVGVYVLAFASMVLGSNPVDVQAQAHLGETGVDEQTAITLRYAGGELAVLSCAVRTNMPQNAAILGTEGMISIPDFWHATSATLRVDGQEPVTINETMGYHYEAAEVMRCLREGRQQSDVMPWDDSIAIARLMDQVRAQIGLTYPME